MRTAVVLIVMTLLAWFFLSQKQREHQKVEAAAKAPAQAASPRPVSEHNWAKHALDKTNKVTRQLAEQRKADGTP